MSAYDSIPYGVADPDDPTATWDDAALRDVDDEHERAVQVRIAALRADAEARQRVAQSDRPPLSLPSLTRLDTFLSEADDDAVYRIADLWPSGGNVVLAAQFKSGKSTAVGNVLRALADGGEFLGEFTTTPARRIVLLDNELDARQLRRWLRAHGITNADRIELVSLRGQLATFDIIDPATRAEWARHIGPADVIIFDCLRPALDALGLDENRDAGRFLVAFDALKAEAGIGEGLLVHHMGHNGERSRGDSRILDWPDATWRIVRETDDPSSARYFSAFGRDVDLAEGRLEFDPTNRHQTYAGGSRREARATGALDVLAPAVLAFVADNPGCSGTKIENGLRGLPGGVQAKRAARDWLVREQRLEARERAGRGGGMAYFTRTPSTPSEPRPDGLQTPSTPYIDGVGVWTEKESNPVSAYDEDPGYCGTCGTTAPRHTKKCPNGSRT